MTAKKTAKVKPPTQGERIKALEITVDELDKRLGLANTQIESLTAHLDEQLAKRSAEFVTRDGGLADRYEGPDGFEVVNGVRTNNYIRVNHPDANAPQPVPPPDVEGFVIGDWVRHKDIPGMKAVQIKDIKHNFVVIDMMDNGEVKPDQMVDWRWVVLA